jgi:outer membrane murein-binding lipoprotein Lpp
MRRILPIVTASAALLAAGCGGSSRPGYYVGTGRSAIALITWSAPQRGKARGTIIDDTLSGTAPGQIVDVQTAPVTVRFNGSAVSFTGTGVYALGAATIRGTLRGGRLSIKAPDSDGYLESAVLRPATPATYRSDLATLRRHVSHANTVAKRAQVHQQDSGQLTSDEQQVSTDVSTLQSDTATLTSDVAQMSADVQQVSADLAQLQSDAANGAGPACENVSTVDSDATTVDSDGSTVGDDATTVAGDIGTVQGDISQLSGDVEALLKAGGSATGDPSPQAVITEAQTEISDATTEANSYITTVNGFMQQAYTTANAINASNCGD